MSIEVRGVCALPPGTPELKSDAEDWMRKEARSGTRGPRPRTFRVRKNEDERTVEDIEPVRLEFSGLEMTSSALEFKLTAQTMTMSALDLTSSPVDWISVD